MTNKLTKLLFFIFLFILTSSIIVSSINDVFYPLSEPSRQRQVLRPLTVVNDATCTTYPSDAGFYVENHAIECPLRFQGKDNKGCQVLLWKGYYKEWYGEYSLNPGVIDIVARGMTYELYPCADTSCKCYDERSKGCGMGNCPEESMLRVRDCTPADCSWEVTCSPHYTECHADCVPNWQCYAWSDCTTSGIKTRKCIDENVCGKLEDKPKEVADCKKPDPDNCGNLVCDEGETYVNCPTDCDPVHPVICGDDVCDPTEDWLSCSKDCLGLHLWQLVVMIGIVGIGLLWWLFKK